MAHSSVVIKKLDKKDRDKATAFVEKMMRWTAKTYSKRRYPKGALNHQISMATRTLDLSIKDPDHYCMLATKDGEMIGIALGQVLGGVGRIDWLAVVPKYQRQGVGTRLMRAVEARMKGSGCHKMTLYVFDSHIPAVGLYLNWGMVPEATLKEHHWGDDYVVMSKWLDMRRRVL